ncbi:UNVERIFIED_CONTAM: hypothetical protein K2H54_070620 [Gekko kuhli]
MSCATHRGVGRGACPTSNSFRSTVAMAALQHGAKMAWPGSLMPPQEPRTVPAAIHPTTDEESDTHLAPVKDIKAADEEFPGGLSIHASLQTCLSSEKLICHLLSLHFFSSAKQTGV